MTSRTSKSERLKQSQLARAKALAGIDTTDPNASPPPGAVLADQKELSHNNTYGRLPRFYVDKVVVCRQQQEVWPAERQNGGMVKEHLTAALPCCACDKENKERRGSPCPHGRAEEGWLKPMKHKPRFER
jgi:hypothetical protein